MRASLIPSLIISSIGLEHLRTRLPFIDHLTKTKGFSRRAMRGAGSEWLLINLAMRSRRAVPLSRNKSADSEVLGTFRWSSETRVPFVDGRRTSALLVSIALQVGFFFGSALSFIAAAFTMSANVKLPCGTFEAAAGVDGEGAPERLLPGFLSSLRGGGGPTDRTVVKAEAMADSKGKCGRADMVAVVTAATCLVKRGSSCQNG